MRVNKVEKNKTNVPRDFREEVSGKMLRRRALKQRNSRDLAGNKGFFMWRKQRIRRAGCKYGKDVMSFLFTTLLAGAPANKC